MPIENFNFNDPGNAGSLPSIGYIETNDTVAQVTTVGYLNGLVRDGIQVSSETMVLVSTKSTPNAAVSSVGFYQVSYSSENWSLVPPSGALVSLPSGDIFVGNASNIATAVTMSGDVTLSNTGVATISALAVTAAKIANATITTTQISATAGILGTQLSASAGILGTQLSASAAIGFSQLAALTSAHILVGNGSNVAASVAMSGDVTISNAGATTISALAVTAAKIANATITTTQIASAAGILGSQLSASAAIAGTQLANNTVGSSQIALNMLQLSVVNLNTAAWTGMYAAPQAVVAAGATGIMWEVDNAFWNYTYGGAAFAGGGNIILQYGNTVNGGGTAAVTAFTPTGFTDQVASTGIKTGGVFAVGALKSATGLFVSNQSGPFTGGAGSSVTLYVWYKGITVA